RGTRFTVGDLPWDVERRTAGRGGENIPLLPKEFTILESMIRHAGAVLNREQLENQIWNYEYSGNSNNIDVYMSRLRKKIDGGREHKLLHTIRGAGWVLREDGQ
ncbi:MAG: response regulator transcription factor, partial [Oscillospiraceae bacterium]|nr:response regulator transcription factor [Oscillospiraceae bacterium]